MLIVAKLIKARRMKEQPTTAPSMLMKHSQSFVLNLIGTSHTPSEMKVLRCWMNMRSSREGFSVFIQNPDI